MADGSGESPRLYSRRRLLLSSAAAAAGGAATVAIGGGAALADSRTSPAPPPAASSESVPTEGIGSTTVPFHGVHQAGISTPAQAHATFCAFDLRDGVDAVGLTKLLKILTDDLERITAGRPALGDTAPELATTPARLTVTIGFGPTLFDKVGLAAARPAGFVELPAFAEIDQLETRYSGGDLILQIAADDPLTVAHAQRMLLKDTRAFAATRWVQRGFLRARGSGAEGTTPRNLMGQVDGTVNPRTDTEFDAQVWSAGPGWFAGGSMMVLRRIRMDMNKWDALDRSAMETTIGRRLSNGAPLTGVNEHDEPDLKATDATGLLAIADFAHLRLARGDGPAPQILRRAYNYDDFPAADGDSDLGLVFCSFQADIERQFIPMQQRLAAGDLLNEWTTPIGSAVFAVPPGCQPGGFIGEGLLT
jgi:dye decolorizing peroxidase